MLEPPAPSRPSSRPGLTTDATTVNPISSSVQDDDIKQYQIAVTAQVHVYNLLLNYIHPIVYARMQTLPGWLEEGVSIQVKGCPWTLFKVYELACFGEHGMEPNTHDLALDKLTKKGNAAQQPHEPFPEYVHRFTQDIKLITRAYKACYPHLEAWDVPKVRKIHQAFADGLADSGVRTLYLSEEEGIFPRTLDEFMARIQKLTRRATLLERKPLDLPGATSSAPPRVVAASLLQPQQTAMATPTAAFDPKNYCFNHFWGECHRRDCSRSHAKLEAADFRLVHSAAEEFQAKWGKKKNLNKDKKKDSGAEKKDE